MHFLPQSAAADRDHVWVKIVGLQELRRTASRAAGPGAFLGSPHLLHLPGLMSVFFKAGLAWLALQSGAAAA